MSLLGELPDGWHDLPSPADRDAVMEYARALAREIEHLTWPDRALLLDRLFWFAANRRLGDAEITAVINRQSHGTGDYRRVAEFAFATRSLLTEVMALLDEPPPVGSAWQALTWLLARREREHAPASAWLALADTALLRQHLAGLPGYAFVMLATSRGDTADSLLARDAFWDAMLGATGEGRDGRLDRLV